MRQVSKLRRRDCDFMHVENIQHAMLDLSAAPCSYKSFHPMQIDGWFYRLLYSGDKFMVSTCFPTTQVKTYNAKT